VLFGEFGYLAVVVFEKDLAFVNVRTINNSSRIIT